MKSNLMVFAVASCCGLAAWINPGEIDRTCRVLGSEPEASQHDAAWVHRRAADWQPTREERAFDEIGWAKDIREALRLAKQHGRPVFLFTYDGANLTCYRC